MKRQQLIALLAGMASSIALQAQEPPAAPANEIRFDAATERAFDRSGKYVTVSQQADGTVLTELNGSFQNVTVARVGAGGKIETLCTTDQEAAIRFMSGEGLEAASTTRLETPVVEQP